MPIVKCKICGNKFYAKPNWLLRGHGKYCSKSCQYIGQKNGIFVKCFVCKKDVYRTPKGLRTSKSKKYFCNKTCQTVWRNSMVFVGPRHANWKGGAYVEYREILLKSGQKPICKRCRNLDKRVLCVHHIDKNRKNNDISNLMWLCHNCHHLHHDFGIRI